MTLTRPASITSGKLPQASRHASISARFQRSLFDSTIASCIDPSSVVLLRSSTS